MRWIWQLCYSNMRQRGVRTGLTVLGVVIGVISIVSMLAIGIGVKNMILSEFEESGSITRITVTGINEGKRREQMVTDRTIADFAKVEHVEAVYPCLSMDGISVYGGYEGYGNILGVPQSLLETMTPVFGELPKDKTITPEIIMGQGALYLFYNYNSNMSYMENVKEEERKNINLTGDKIDFQMGFDYDVSQYRLPVVGMLGMNEYNSYCDIEVLKRFLKKNSEGETVYGQPVREDGDAYSEWIYSSAIVYADSPDNVDSVIKKLQNMGFQTENQKEYLETMQKTVRVIQIMLGGIGMIALIVAVIGIGNTMTTSVYDRINEIGILKVLGCDMDELVLLFLVESGILGGLGGLIGLLCSALLVRLVINPVAVRLLELERGTQLAVIPSWLSLAALVMAVLLGVLAGFFPAKWAARLNPIRAVQR